MLAARPLWPALVPGESRCELKQPKQLRELQLKHELEHCVLEGRASSSRTARLACACGAAASLAVLRTLRPSAHSASSRLAIRLRQAERTMEVLDMNAVTQDFFGHSLRPQQREVVEAVVQGKDAVVLWSTGSGKSLCYQLVPIITQKVVLVVSPLIALMKDQVDKFNAQAERKGEIFRACFLGTGHEDVDRRLSIEAAALQGKYSLVYVTPEKLIGNMLDGLRTLYKQGKLGLLAIDEAHCILEWGGDFRPEYRDLGFFREDFRKVPIMALTSLKTPAVQGDIQMYLELNSPKVFQGQSFRPNLHLKRTISFGFKKDLKRIAEQISDGSGRTIIYVRKRDDVDKVTKQLKELLPSLNPDRPAVTVGSYHARIEQRQRDRAHSEFASMGGDSVMVATVAYGMGVHFPDVRRVYHLGSPWTVESYWQQIGRAGRDGEPATCEVISCSSDFEKAIFSQGLQSEAWEWKSMEHMRRMLHGQRCRWTELLRYLGEEPEFGEVCGACDVCAAAAKRRTEDACDMTKEAVEVLQLVKTCMKSNREPTPAQVVDLLCGKIPRGRTNKGERGWKSVADDIVPEEVFRRCQEMTGLTTKVDLRKLMREVVETLAGVGYLRRKTVSYGPFYRTRKYQILTLTAEGLGVLEKVDGGSTPKVNFPVNHAFRQLMVGRAAKMKKMTTKKAVKTAKESSPKSQKVSDQQEEQFNEKLEQCKSFWNRHERWPKARPPERTLYDWLNRQQRARDGGKLPADRLQKCLEVPEIARRWAEQAQPS